MSVAGFGPDQHLPIGKLRMPQDEGSEAELAGEAPGNLFLEPESVLRMIESELLDEAVMRHVAQNAETILASRWKFGAERSCDDLGGLGKFRRQKLVHGGSHMRRPLLEFQGLQAVEASL